MKQYKEMHVLVLFKMGGVPKCGKRFNPLKFGHKSKNLVLRKKLIFVITVFNKKNVFVEN